MNDTTRGEVRERVDAKLEKYADDYAAWQDGGLEDTGLDDSRQIAAEIIALVTAARDAEIREALLSKSAIEAGAKAVRALDWEVDEVGFFPTTEDVARVSLKAALTAITAPTGDHIGLGDEAGGQG